MEELNLTKALKQEWLDALKSGKYKQAKSMLKKEDKHCCLGVLCEIHPRLSINETGYEPIFDGNRYSTYEPLNQLLKGDITTQRLYQANDNNTPGDYSNVIPLIEALPTID